MSNNLAIIIEAVLIPLAVLITYYDVRYRRIPNAFVLGALGSGLAANTIYNGPRGLFSSITGCVVGLGLMLILRFFTGLGAGDVKLFGAIGAVIGVQLVLPTFLIIVLAGGILAVHSMLSAGTVRHTMLRVWHLFAGKHAVSQIVEPALASVSRQTIPYGVAITFGSVISVASEMRLA